ncbi:DNA ligase D [Sphingomonas gilva]|uniref:DNA ligase (ATP) n=1 Tax=Sphingomonas gilva TaxID=2305907 RepID=A0A396RPM1_9SPHN|nr:DNA ligase D [Sphingomonas gilva]RHW18339.1 DNA ligase D [Sphingomonas gilva]
MPKSATDPLATYNAKRDFAKTAEPAGKVAKGKDNRFIVQKHDATRLHWDFRLELDGVLKSWAVTRGPSLDPADKRLAVRTEDHPMSYADFEGTIPKGEYGGGSVMLWDVGTWAPVAGKSAKDLAKGHLHFILDGERMKGEWLLVRIKGRPGEKRENWLLRKIEDEEAGGSDTLVQTGLTSVKTGRTMREIADGKILPGTGRGTATRSGVVEGARRKSGSRGRPPPPSSGRSPSPSRGGFPKFVAPQLATLVDSVPTGSAWLHEVKYDGYRAIVAVGGGKAKIFTRTGLDWTDKFPGVAEAAAALDVGSALIDGEITALKDGRPDFSTLQQAISEGGEMVMFAFDLLSLDGTDLRKLPNIQRKERLRPLIPASGTIQFAEHIVGAGEKLFDAMCDEGYEGIVCKRADAPYRSVRTKSWLKVKCTRRQEFVIIGWNESSAKGRGFSSLLLALNEEGGLRYAGKVGTGFNTDTIADLRDRFDKLARKSAPVEVPRAIARKAHWVSPKLVAEVAFGEFTADGVIRHASFIGLRGDKPAAEVRAEAPAATPELATLPVKITNPDRVIFPGEKLTKGDLAAYAAAVAPLMLPWVGSRPISLVRCPQGRAKHCFFQKHDSGSFGEAVKHVPIREKKGGTEDYLYVDDATGILQCVQMGTIEFHGWASSVATLDRPDRMVFDLDPDEGLDFDKVVKAAEKLKTVLGDLGLTSFPMLSGGKGVHVVVPLAPEADWERFTGFAERFSRAMAADDPDRFTATMSKAKRKGRIFLDWLRNQRGSTAIMPYSARARAGAPVAAPITWAELKDVEGANIYSIRDTDTLLERARGRGLRGWGVSDQILPDL